MTKRLIISATVEDEEVDAFSTKLAELFGEGKVNIQVQTVAPKGAGATFAGTV